jgi:predicted TIM-barrel fold metal-dependent hydrolase
MASFGGFPEELKGLKVIDADTHYSEPHDLWTSRVPASYRDRVPHVADDGKGGKCWRFNGDDLLFSSAGSASVIRKDGSKAALMDWDIQNGTMPIVQVHPASYDGRARLELMDQQGVWAHVMYPNVTGFGAHRLMTLEDRELAFTILSVYNDAVAELQAGSGGRLFPQALIPFWNLDAAVAEVERAKNVLKLTGITMSSEPHSAGLPDITSSHWAPLWEVCESLGVPVNFHVGSSEFGKEAFEKGTWPGLSPIRKHVVGCVLLELHNARVLANLLTSDLLVRYPKLRFVSVESGIGWIPYVLERLEYQLLETSLDGRVWEQERPTELFRRQVYSCFWFEEAAPSRTLDFIGFDNVLFESDFPHPTCLYPSPVEHGLKVLAPWGAAVQRKVMSENAAKLYGIPV